MIFELDRASDWPEWEFKDGKAHIYGPTKKPVLDWSISEKLIPSEYHAGAFTKHYYIEFINLDCLSRFIRQYGNVVIYPGKIPKLQIYDDYLE